MKEPDWEQHFLKEREDVFANSNGDACDRWAMRRAVTISHFVFVAESAELQYEGGRPDAISAHGGCRERGDEFTQGRHREDLDTDTMLTFALTHARGAPGNSVGGHRDAQPPARSRRRACAGRLSAADHLVEARLTDASMRTGYEAWRPRRRPLRAAKDW
jgi:hypothetical protein